MLFSGGKSGEQHYISQDGNGKCPDIEEDTNHMRLYAMFLAREFKIISRMNMTDDKLQNAVISFSKSMMHYL